jgi:hypothetical protein
MNTNEFVEKDKQEPTRPKWRLLWKSTPKLNLTSWHHILFFFFFSQSATSASSSTPAEVRKLWVCVGGSERSETGASANLGSVAHSVAQKGCWQ